MRVLPLIPALFALMLVSCIEGEEEIWLERDGSGHMEATYKMPAVVIQKLGGPEEFVRSLNEAAARDPHVTITRTSHETRNGEVTLRFAARFDDLRKLATFPQRQFRDPARPDVPAREEVLFGETEIDVSWRGISYQRTIDISSLLQSNPLARNFVRVPALLKDSSFRYILNLPASATETNATTRSGNGHRLEWRFLLREHVRDPMYLSARGKIPLPGILWFLGLVPLFALIVLFFIRNRRSMARLQRLTLGDRVSSPRESGDGE